MPPCSRNCRPRARIASPPVQTMPPSMQAASSSARSPASRRERRSVPDCWSTSAPLNSSSSGARIGRNLASGMVSSLPSGSGSSSGRAWSSDSTPRLASASVPVCAMKSSSAGTRLMRWPSSVTPRSRSNQSIPDRSVSSNERSPDGSTRWSGKSSEISTSQPSSRRRGRSPSTNSSQAAGSGSIIARSRAWGWVSGRK